MGRKLIDNVGDLVDVIIAMVPQECLSLLKLFPMSDEIEIKNFLRKARRISDKIIERDILKNYFMPQLISDFSILNQCEKLMDIFTTQDMEYLILYGENDSVIEKSLLKSWNNYGRNVQQIGFSGEHFSCMRIRR